MSDSASRPAKVGDAPDLGPLSLGQDGERWRFTLTSPEEMTLELPPDYEHFLSERLKPVLGARAEPRVVMDLQGLPAISSRQLGLMLALHKALSKRVDRLPITGISDGVRRLLDLTRTAQFFEQR